MTTPRPALYTSCDARGWVAYAIRDAITARLNVIFDSASDDPGVS